MNEAKLAFERRQFEEDANRTLLIRRLKFLDTEHLRKTSPSWIPRTPEAIARTEGPLPEYPERARIEAEVDARLNAMLGEKKPLGDQDPYLSPFNRALRLVARGALTGLLLISGVRLIFWFYSLIGLK